MTLPEKELKYGSSLLERLREAPLAHRLTTTEKALQINLDKASYGTFAEIGAGQEVARHFFQAGKASQTIAKTMSAYDMIYSDAIYGKSGRYVCEERLLTMLDHEYALILERLNEKRGCDSHFFVFADTVSGKTKSNRTNCHGWMGVRFQTKPGQPPNDFILHIRMHDARRLHQQQALGVVGVNMLHAALHLRDTPEKIVPSLTDNLESGRIEIDMIRFEGPDVRHINNRLLSLELIRHDLTQAVVFCSTGKVLQPSDEIYAKPLFVQRGTFRPVTKANIEIQIQGISQFLEEPVVKNAKNPLIFMELTMQNLTVGGEIDSRDFLERVETLNSLGHQVLISNCFRFHELKKYLRRYTDKLIGLVVGASQLEKLFDESFYEDLEGGAFEAMGQLFDGEARLYVFPQKEGDRFLLAKDFRPPASLEKLYEFLLLRKDIVDIEGAEGIDASMDAEDVRKHLQAGDSRWEEMVPMKVRDLIKKKGFFGWRG